jgi:DNA-binding transcriptional ArsR family regulator
LNDEDALRILVALGDSVRFEIYRKVRETPGLSSSELKSGKAASTISHHTKLLVDARVLETARDGKHIRYSIHSGTLVGFAEWAASPDRLLPCRDISVALKQ